MRAQGPARPLRPLKLPCDYTNNIFTATFLATNPPEIARFRVLTDVGLGRGSAHSTRNKSGINPGAPPAVDYASNIFTADLIAMNL